MCRVLEVQRWKHHNLQWTIDLCASTVEHFMAEKNYDILKMLRLCATMDKRVAAEIQDNPNYESVSEDEKEEGSSDEEEEEEEGEEE